MTKLYKIKCVCPSGVLMNKKYDFIEGNITPTFFYHSIPVIFSMLFAASVSIVDGWFVGKYIGPDGLAAINIVMPILNLLWGLNIMLVVGSTVSIGKQLGAEKYEMANYIFSKTIIGVAAANIGFAVLALFFEKEILVYLGATPEIMQMASDYYFYVVLFTLFYGINLTISYFIRLEGRTAFVATGLILFVLGNIFLDWLFIGFLGWGMKGAAYATSFAELFSTLFLLSHYFNPCCILKFSFKLKRWRRLMRSCYNGVSEFITESAVGVVLMLFNISLIKYIGLNGVVAFTIINYFLLVQYTTVTAIGDSMQPVLAINYGRKKWDRINAFICHAFKFSFAVGAFASLILYFYAEQISNFFVDETNATVHQIIREFAKVFWITFLLNGITVNISTYFTATSRPRNAAIVSFSGGIIFPIISIKVLPLFFGAAGIYWALPVSQTVSFLLACGLFYYDTNYGEAGESLHPEKYRRPEAVPDSDVTPEMTPKPDVVLNEALLRAPAMMKMKKNAAMPE